MQDFTNPPQSYWDEHKEVFKPIEKDVLVNGTTYFVWQEYEYDKIEVMNHSGDGIDISSQLAPELLEQIINLARE